MVPAERIESAVKGISRDTIFLGNKLKLKRNLMTIDELVFLLSGSSLSLLLLLFSFVLFYHRLF